MQDIASPSIKLAVRKLLSLAGLSIVSNRVRDVIVDAVPNLSQYFILPEKIARPAGLIPDEAYRYLTYNNPALEDYRRRYIGHPAANHVQWDGPTVEKHIDLRYFRADNLYMYQSRRYTPLDFYANAAYAKISDKLRLWCRFEEDDVFGAEIFDFHGKVVSRDLLDSVLETNFIDQCLSLFTSGGVGNILDVGAGYGRLAHRLGSILPKGWKYFCIDAVPESTFISSYYLKYRNVGDQVEVVPLDDIHALVPIKLDLAVNIHSFPECRFSVIEWWLRRLQEMGAKCLFIVVASSLGLSSNEGDGTRRDFQPLIEQLGYRMVSHQHKFEASPVLVKRGAYPSEYYMFKRT
jgi:putative sugar O-methyltransferase